MKIATWNVNSINVRLEQMRDWLAKSGADVLCIQETKTVDENFPVDGIRELGFEAVFTGEKSYNGVAIVSKYEMSEVQKNFPDDDVDAPKRLIAATVKGVRIVNTYIPNGTELWTDKFDFKLDWLQRLRKFFEASFERDSDVLLCGDFNVAPEEPDVWSVKNWEGKLHFSIPERAALDHVRMWGFTDLYRLRNGDLQEFSWWNYRQGAFPKNQGLRIDHVWASESLASKCTDCYIDREPRTWERPSDHTPVVAEFELDR